MRRTWGAAMVLGMLLALTGCAAEPKPTTPGEMFSEYIRNTHVKNDVWVSQSGTVQDREASFAAYGPPGEAASYLLGANSCADIYIDQRPGKCAPSKAASTALRAVAGPNADVGSVGMDLYQRLILVKHKTGEMELIDTYVVKKPGDGGVLVDDDGRSYRNLTDFQQHNRLLGHDDLILTLQDIASVTGKSRAVVVPGHTKPSPWPTLGPALAVIALITAGLVMWRRPIARQLAEFVARLDDDDDQPKRPEM